MSFERDVIVYDKVTGHFVTVVKVRDLNGLNWLLDAP